MNLKKLVILFISLVACLIVFLFTKPFLEEDVDETTYFSIQGNTIRYDNLALLESDTDLILQVNVVGNSKVIDFPRQPKESEFLLENPYAGYTTTEVEIISILNDQYDEALTPGETLRIMEPIYPTEQEGKEIVITFNDYSRLYTGGNYILFLNWNENTLLYEIGALSFAKYNLDGMDKNEVQLAKGNYEYESLKKEVLAKYYKD